MYNELINTATKEYPFLVNHVNVKYIPHFHEETEIVYVIRGEFVFTLGMLSSIAKEGDICIIPSKMIHNLYTEHYSETFVMKLYSIVDLSNIHLDKYIISQSDPGYQQIHEYICRIMVENDQKNDHYKLAVNINAENIFLFILRETQYQRTDGKIKLKQIHESNFLETINTFLEAHYTDDFSLSDIAAHLNYTKSYFCRYFKKATGTTFWEYYTMFRLEKSIHYIQLSSKETFTVIARKSGFKNARSFYEAFSNYYHCTPREYRKMLMQL